MSRNLRAWLVLLGAPLLSAVVCALIVWSWRDVLPDPIASHWGLGSSPDGFSSIKSAIAMSLVLPLLALPISAVVLVVSGGAKGRMVRFAGAFAGGFGAFMASISPATLYQQRGLTDARDAGGPDFGLLVALGCAVVVGTAAWWLMPKPLPRPKATGPLPAGAARLELPTNTRATLSELVYSRNMLLILGVVTGGMFLFALLAQQLFLAIIAIGMVLLILATAAMRITVGAHGIRARGLIGFPVIGVPLDEVVVATMTTVNPMLDFGGWGYRMGPDGRYGVVMRQGPAVSVKCSDDSTFVVTLAEAEQAAALLNTLAERARP